MRYKLFNENRNFTTDQIIRYGVVRYALENRGVDDVRKYLALNGDECVCPFNNLNNINEAVEMFNRNIEKKSPVSILVDPDVDGYTSAAMIYSVIKRIDENYPVTYLIHRQAKAHGLTGDIEVPRETRFLIIPDAGTNDTLMCRKLKNVGVDILILDHHQKDEKVEENIYACIVNNQLSMNYWNKDFCGAGIVYKFLQALDDENWTDYADDYLDMVAIANISDNMDIRSHETKYYIYHGLNNIRNKCISGFIKAQDFRMKGHINIHNIQWYITPMINGMIRVGSFEEKDLMFRAFIEQDEDFEYEKRATKNTPKQVIKETIYERVPRLCSNAKSRQDRLKEKGLREICKIIDECPVDDKVIVADVTDVLDKSLSGLVAIKVADMYNKPCILLKKYNKEEDDSSAGKKFKQKKKEVYGGSARNINYSPIDSLRDVVVSSDEFLLASGHDNAFGVELEVGKIDEAVNKLNHILKDVKYDSTYRVDMIIECDDVDIGLINELSVFPDYIGSKIDELLIAVENIEMERDDFNILGKKEDTIKFTVNDVDFIMHGCKEDNKLYEFLNNAWDENDYVVFTVVGEPCISEYQGVRTPQINIKDLNVIRTSIDEEDFDDIW